MGRRCETLFLGKALQHGVVHGEKWPFSEDSLLCVRGFHRKVTSLISALYLQLGLLGSPPDPVGCFPMRGGPSHSIIDAKPTQLREL